MHSGDRGGEFCLFDIMVHSGRPWGLFLVCLLMGGGQVGWSRSVYRVCSPGRVCTPGRVWRGGTGSALPARARGGLERKCPQASPYITAPPRELEAHAMARRFNVARKHPSGLASPSAFLMQPCLVIPKDLVPILDLS